MASSNRSTSARPEAPRPRRSWSFSIGRVAGIDIRVHASFLLLVVLFALAGAAPESPGVVDSLLWLVVIFACVVVHELAHCFVGRTRGAVVHEIVLLPIGGVSKLEHLPDAPRDELAMAIAGPLASIGLGLAAALAAWIASAPLLPIDLASGPWLARVAWFNLLIAAFNLLPAFPLDGGRVFRALLEQRYDLVRATRIAVRFGHAVAVTMIAIGLLWNVWFVLLGFFVYFGASAEEAATLVHARLVGRRVGEVMMREPVVVFPDTSVEQLRVLLRQSTQRAFPVVIDDEYRGMIDATAIGRAAPAQTATDIADHATPAADVRDSVEDDLPLVISAPAQALAVVDRGAVAGLLRIEDVEHLVEADDLTR